MLSGSGVIAGTLTSSAGFVSPGHSAGMITVVGDFAQTADGTLIVEEGGPLPHQFDQVICTGSASHARPGRHFLPDRGKPPASPWSKFIICNSFLPGIAVAGGCV